MTTEYDPDLMARLGNDHRKVALLDWLCTVPSLRIPETMDDLADELGVTSRSLRNWKSAESFLKVWRKHSNEVIGSPEKTQRLLENLLAVGMDREHRQMVQAANTFLKATGAIQPPERQEATKSALADMTIEQLQAMAAQVVQRELHERAKASA